MEDFDAIANKIAGFSSQFDFPNESDNAGAAPLKAIKDTVAMPTEVIARIDVMSLAAHMVSFANVF